MWRPITDDLEPDERVRASVLMENPRRILPNSAASGKAAPRLGTARRRLV